MYSLIKYYLKQNSILILLILIISLLGRMFSPGFEVINVFLIWVLAYRLAAEERNKKNWNYFQSLPISFLEKTVVKIIFPVVLLTLLWMTSGLTFLGALDEPTHQFFWAALIQASVLTLGSLMARNLIQYALIILGFFLLSSIFKQALLQVFLCCVFMGIAVYVLSGRRWNFWRTVGIAIIVASPLAILDRLANEQILLSRLGSRDFSKKLAAAQIILDKDRQHAKARQALTAIIEEDLSPEQLQQLFKLLRRYRLTVEIPEERFWQFIGQDRRTREIIYRYFSRQRQNYTFLHSLDFIRKAEGYSVHGSPPCEDDCEVLAILTGKYVFDLEGGDTHVLEHLQSSSLIRINYALIILEQQAQIMFQDQLKELKERIRHPGIRSRIDLLLNDSKLDRIGVDLGGAIGKKIDEQLKKNLSTIERRRINRIIRQHLEGDDKNEDEKESEREKEREE